MNGKFYWFSWKISNAAMMLTKIKIIWLMYVKMLLNRCINAYNHKFPKPKMTVGTTFEVSYDPGNLKNKANVKPTTFMLVFIFGLSISSEY